MLLRSNNIKLLDIWSHTLRIKKKIDERGRLLNIKLI